MKYNFIVSDYRHIWNEQAKRLFILEPYVYYQLKKDGHLKDYDDVKVAPYRRQSRNDLEKDYHFVQDKFDKYVNILVVRLNEVHSTSYGERFWKKSLSVSFERYITFLHDLFENCELYFNVNKHDCYVLSKKSYYVPLDFDDQRTFFQHSHYGQEQIFSIYMDTFYPDGLKTKDGQFHINTESSHGNSKKKLFARIMKQDFSRATFEKIKHMLLKKYYAHRNHEVGIYGSFFSYHNLNHLMIKSKGRIYPLEWQLDINDNDANFLSWDSRKYLSETQQDFDKFDRFFFASMEYCFPRIFVEHFKKVEDHYKHYFSQSKDLRFVTSEAWPSVTSLSIALAMMGEKGVRHIYNEHNYIAHPWVGSEIFRAASLCDIFVSLGWDNNKIPNLIKGASLREYTLNAKKKKKHKICYISGVHEVKRPQYTASYGTSAENVLKYIEFKRSFFDNLRNETRSEILYRGYPKAFSESILCYDETFMLAPYLEYVKKYDNTNISGRLVMIQSRLVIIDYISTSHLESMLMNIPTILFWNPETYYLNNECLDYFDSLISVGICQVNPIVAAHFVESIKDDPEKWWLQDTVQKAKDEFLQQNMGKPEVMIDYLMGLLKANEHLKTNDKEDNA